MPTIPSYLETEIKRIRVQASPGTKKDVRFHLSGKKLDMVACTCHHGGKDKTGESQSRTGWAKMRPYLLNNQSKKG
jgi:hypothetical protein